MRQGLLECTRALIPNRRCGNAKGLSHPGKEAGPCQAPAWPTAVAAVAICVGSLEKHTGTSHWTASDLGIHHAPRVMAQVVGRAAEVSGDGTLAS
jgi:hypothetical protein